MKLFISNNLSGLNRTASELCNIKLRFKKRLKDIFPNDIFSVLPKYGVINSKFYIIGTRSHGGDGGYAMLRRCRRHKELRRCSVQILDNYFGINALGIKLLKSVLTSSVALCTDGASVTSIALF